MLNFDEFRAISARERNKESSTIKGDDNKENSSSKLSQDASTKADDSSSGNNAGQTSSGGNSTLLNIEEFLELMQTQFLIVAMLLSDTFASFAMLYLGNLRDAEGSTHVITLYNISLSVDLIQSVLKTFTSFTLMLFSLEIILLVLMFRALVIGHFGYLIDITVISCQMYYEIKGYGLECRILNVFRMWRLVRLFEGLVNIEKDAHAETRALLEARDSTVAKLESKMRGLQNDVQKEKEARSSIEDMLRSYKEEVDTLNEALKIAAMDIADVGQADDDFFLSDEEEEEGEDDDGSKERGVYVDASASQHERNKNKEVLYREAKAMMDMQAAGLGATTTFLVRDDGKYELR